MTSSSDAITIKSSQLQELLDFVDRSLERQWDHHTDHHICSDSWEDGKRRMDPTIYDLREELISQLNQ